MKKRAVEILITSMLAVSLTGCGTKVEATSQNVFTEEAVIVTDAGEAEEDVNTNDDTIATETGDEIVGGNIVFYPELIGIFPDEPSTFFEYEMIDEEVTVEDDVPVYVAGGREVGYIKSGATIRLVGHGINSSEYQLENLSGIGYEYVYVYRDDLLTLNDMKELVVKHIDYMHTIIDVPESDMEYIEFTIEKSTRSGVEDYVCECLENETFDYNDYSIFCVECTKNERLVDVRVYYK